MKVLLIYLIFFLPVALKAQNLIPNGSFEDTMKCGGIGLPCDPAGWLYIKKGATNGYAHMIDGIPAYDGNRKLCFTVGSGQFKKRTYWETILLKELKKGTRYNLTMYIHGWDILPNLNDLGVWFVDSLFFVDEDTILQPKRYMDILQARVRQEKNGWFKIEQQFVPDMNARYMLVGNFSPKDNQKLGQYRGSRSFYLCDFVDDIRIEPVKKGSCADCPLLRDSIYLVSQQLFLQQRSLPRQEKEIETANTVAKSIDTLELPNVLFALNSSKMLDSSSLMQYKTTFSDPKVLKIVVAGYADSTGTKEYNIALAEKRAQEVAKQVENQFNVNPATIEAIGKGVSYKYEQMDLNRRVEIYIYRN